VPRESRPAPTPDAAIRPRVISVTDVDRLQADPFAFYAKAMLKLRPLEDVDAEPDARWRGTAIHDVLDQWFVHDACDPAKLQPRVTAMLGEAQAHPLLRTLWGPRLHESIEWIGAQVEEDRAKGRQIVASECKGTIQIAGVKLHGRADRIDRTADDMIGVIDYKTGKAPSAKAVTAGFSMQLGLLGLIAERGGFDGVSGTAGVFEYWSLAKANGKFGKRSSPVGGRSDWPVDQFVARSASVFQIAADNWLTGNAPFTAKLVPDFAPYEDYDQLMRRDEWYGREGA
jgi:ATP-dependent helicase/nuclease subunit B